MLLFYIILWFSLLILYTRHVNNNIPRTNVISSRYNRRYIIWYYVVNLCVMLLLHHSRLITVLWRCITCDVSGNMWYLVLTYRYRISKLTFEEYNITFHCVYFFQICLHYFRLNKFKITYYLTRCNLLRK